METKAPFYVLSGITGAILVSVLACLLIELCLPKPHGAEIGILFPYLTHPVGWILGILGYTAFRTKPIPPIEARQRFGLTAVILAGAFFSPCLLLVTGPVIIWLTGFLLRVI